MSVVDNGLFLTLCSHCLFLVVDCDLGFMEAAATVPVSSSVDDVSGWVVVVASVLVSIKVPDDGTLPSPVDAVCVFNCRSFVDLLCPLLVVDAVGGGVDSRLDLGVVPDVLGL